jgi:hypothetical protein
VRAEIIVFLSIDFLRILVKIIRQVFPHSQSGCNMATTMAKKKSEHKVPRVSVPLPKPWADLARKLAAKNKQPMLWLILSLLATEAENQKVDRPSLPWESGEAADGDGDDE